MKRLILISCVSQKLQRRAKARDLYISPLFRLNLRYAEKLTPDEIYVLSAKYGLLSLEEEIEPYELTLNNMRASEVKSWASHVLAQLKSRCSIDASRFTFLAGEKYRRYLIPYLSNYEVPFEGLRIGKQLQKLKELTV